MTVRLGYREIGSGCAASRGKSAVYCEDSDDSMWIIFIATRKTAFLKATSKQDTRCPLVDIYDTMQKFTTIAIFTLLSLLSFRIGKY